MSIYNIDGKEFKIKDNHCHTFSVLGDSFSAIDGFVEPEDNAVFYPNEYVTNVEQMWWYLFAKNYGSVLQMNNSYSGSRIANDPYWTAGDDTKTFIGRMNNIGKPSMLFILGGTNDVWNGVGLGEYIYSDWTEENLQTFRPALAYMFDYLLKHNVGMKIIFMLNPYASASTDEYDESIKTVCEYYNIDVIELSDVELLGNHPSEQGMKQIRNKLMEYFGIEPNVVSEITTSITFPLTKDAGLSDAFELTETIEQYGLYKVVLDGVSDSGANFEIRFNTNVVAVSFPTNQNGVVEITFEATQYDATNTVKIRGAGTINDLKIYKLSYDA